MHGFVASAGEVSCRPGYQSSELQEMIQAVSIVRSYLRGDPIREVGGRYPRWRSPCIRSFCLVPEVVYDMAGESKHEV